MITMICLRVSTREVGDRNERLETDVSFKRNDPDFLQISFSLLSLSLSLSTPRALPRIHNDDALDTENESEKKRDGALRDEQKSTRSFSRAVMVPRIRSEEISNVVEDRSAENG